MFKRVKRKPEKSQCWRCFLNRVRYVTNRAHPHHYLKKVVLAAINFACVWGQAAKDFIRAVHEAQDLGEVRKSKVKSGGNPTKDIFFELVYSAPKWVQTTLEQRNAIDEIITAPFKNCPIRRGWHPANWDLAEEDRPENWKPIDDAHYLISARDNFGKATISTRFGDGKQTLESWMLRVDEQICDLLNQTRDKKHEPVRPKYIRGLEDKLGIKLTKLHELIAHHTSEPVTRGNLADVIEELERPFVKNSTRKAQVAKVINKDRTLEEDKLVFVHFTGRKEPNEYRIRKLLLGIANTQLDIKLSRPEGHEDHGGGAGGNHGGGGGGLVSLPAEATPATKTAPAPATRLAPEETGLAKKSPGKPMPKGVPSQKPPANPAVPPMLGSVPQAPNQPASSQPVQPQPKRLMANDLMKPSAEIKRAQKESMKKLEKKYKNRRQERKKQNPEQEME